jgi:hypothetical protein
MLTAYTYSIPLELTTYMQLLLRRQIESTVSHFAY